MTAGLSATVADAMLGVTQLTGSSGDCVYVQLHTGDPGSAGTANVSSVTTRESVTWGTASGGSVSNSTSSEPEWTDWGGTSGETVTYISFWSASTGGTFGMSMELSGSGVTMATGDSLTLTSLTVSMTLAS